jgi:chemotaxis protein histidine kinase CheA
MTAFHERVRPLLTRMQRCLERWLVRPRIRRYALELRRCAVELVELTDRVGFAAFGREARALVAILDGVCAMPRPPRSAMAQVEQLIDQLDIALAMYQQLHLEIASTEQATSIASTLVRARMCGADGVAGLARFLQEHGVVTLAHALAHDDVRAELVPGAIADTAAMFAPVPADFDAPGRAFLEHLLREASAAAAEIERAPVLAAAVARTRGAIAAAAAAIHQTWLDDLGAPLASAARTLAADLGKQVAVDIDASGIAVAATQRRAIAEIAIHAVRNAIDHGIESPEQRTAAGKAAAGRIKVRIDGDDQRISVEIADDGRGIDLDAVCARAIASGRLSMNQAAKATEPELLALLFEPGFSTAPAVTMVSGRGVGMDVIRTLARQLDGDVAIASQVGRGTRLRIELASPIER